MMPYRAFALALALLWCGCSNSANSSGDILATGRVCLRQADGWLATPSDNKKLKQALQSAKEASTNSKAAPGTIQQTVIADLDLLHGALNLAKLSLDEGHDPTGPFSMSETPATSSVTTAAEQLRTDLARLESEHPAP